METDRLLNLRYTGFSRKNFNMVYRFFEDNKQCVTAQKPPFAPYCFVAEADFNDIPKEILKGTKLVNGEFVTHEGQPAVLLQVSAPRRLRKLRYQLEDEEIASYEADVPYARRVMIDRQLKVKIPKKILYWDIETDSRKEFPRPINPYQRIILFGCIDRDGNKFAICDDDEVRMIQTFLNLASKYEALCGWFTSGFDIPYVIARARRLNIKVDPFSLPDYDLLKIYKRFFKKKQESYSLSAVVHKICGYEIADWGDEGTVHKMFDMFKHDRKKLINYCLKQVQAVRDIDEKLKLIDMWSEICKTACLLPYAQKKGKSEYTAELPGNSKIIDNLVMLKAQELEKQGQPRTVFPTKVFSTEDAETYMGGFVRNPLPGIWNHVIDIDAAQQYPAIIKTFNIGISTYCSTAIPGNILARHGSFKQEPRSILAQIVKTLSDERYKAKRERNKYHPTDPMYDVWDKIQFGKKFITNSVYGICGFPGSRYFKREIAENITSYARAILQYASNYMKDYYTAIYGDTDSVFMCPTFEYKDVDELLEVTRVRLDKLNEALKVAINKQWNAPIEQIDVKFEFDTIFDKLYLTEKKKCYAGKVFWQNGDFIEPYTHIRGFETVRSSTLLFAREFQKNILDWILDGKPMSQIVKENRSIKAEFMAGKYDEQLYYMIGLSKPIDQYATETATVKAAKKMLSMNRDVRVGDKIKFVKGANGRTILAGENISHDDRKYIWDQYVEPILKRLNICETQATTLDTYGIGLQLHS